MTIDRTTTHSIDRNLAGPRALGSLVAADPSGLAGTRPEAHKRFVRPAMWATARRPRSVIT